jgi:predicted alpha/beta-fold hydrolase
VPDYEIALATVFAQSGTNHRFNSLIYNRGATQISAAFWRHAGSQVAGSSFAVLGFSLGGKTESLLRAFMGFHFWHWNHSTDLFMATDWDVRNVLKSGETSPISSF